MMQEIERLWSGYWTGFGDIALELPTSPGFQREVFHSGTIWEYLIEGVAECVDKTNVF
jgi:hypothetical protein